MPFKRLLISPFYDQMTYAPGTKYLSGSGKIALYPGIFWSPGRSGSSGVDGILLERKTFRIGLTLSVCSTLPPRRPSTPSRAVFSVNIGEPQVGQKCLVMVEPALELCEKVFGVPVTAEQPHLSGPI